MGVRVKQLPLNFGTLHSGNSENDDPFELFISTTSIRYCYYKEAQKLLGTTHGMAVLQAIIEKSRSDPGNLRFDLLIQDSRRNHMTLVESWRSSDLKTTHSRATHTRDYRDALAPLMGSLYDERLYRPL